MNRIKAPPGIIERLSTAALGADSFLAAICLWSCLILLVGAGCRHSDNSRLTGRQSGGNQPALHTDLPSPSGGFVLSVAGRTITSDEIIGAAVEQDGRLVSLAESLGPIARQNDFERFAALAISRIEQAVVSKISAELLYQKAKNQFADDIDKALDKEVQNKVREFILGFDGDYAKAEQSLKQSRLDWESFKDQQKKMLLNQYYIAQQLPEDKPVTYSEMMEYYEQMKERHFSTAARITFRLIDIQPMQIELADPNQDRRQKARDLARELLGRLHAGEDFAELARQYSNGHRRFDGGLWKPVQPDSLAEPYDVLAEKALEIEPGQIAGPIETADHIFIMKLEEKLPKSTEPFEKVQHLIEQRILADRRARDIREFSDRFARQAAVSNKDEFISFCLQRIYVMSNQ